MKRVILLLGLAYLGLAVWTRLMEAAGRFECGCSDDCWCKKPVLSLFRWVVPRFHKGETRSFEAIETPVRG